MRRPNFLFVITDQQRADHLGCAGHPVLRTPAIDAIAARGLRMDRHYVAMPICMPNRATLVTGRMPSRHGVRHNGIELPLDSVTVPELLADAGYRTALVGKSHLQNFTAVPAQYGAEARPDGHLLPSAGLRSARRAGDLSGLRQEDADSWADPTFRMRMPYYGFQSVDLVTRHGDRCGGDYLRWACEREPAFGTLPGRERAFEAPGFTTREGWRTRVPEALYSTNYVAERTIERLREFARTPDTPFFLYSSFPDPHHPWTPPGRYWDMYRPEDVELPQAYWSGPARTGHPALDAYRDQRDTPPRGDAPGALPIRGAYACSPREAREALALTWGMIAMIDDAVGRIDAELRALGLDRDTVVVFTSDHGDYMGDHQLMLKSSLHYQGLVRTPFLWADPALPAQAGTSRDQLTGAIDVARTILERARVAPSDGMQGLALGRMFQDPQAATRDALLIEDEDHRTPAWRHARARVRTLVTDRHRLSLYAGTEFGELYDLVHDPLELENLWAQPGTATLRAALTERLTREVIDTADVLPRPTRFA
jgi:arylsulfatase A-like enzyme